MSTDFKEAAEAFLFSRSFPSWFFVSFRCHFLAILLSHLCGSSRRSL